MDLSPAERDDGTDGQKDERWQFTNNAVRRWGGIQGALHGEDDVDQPIFYKNELSE